MTPDGGNATFAFDSDASNYAKHNAIQRRMQSRFDGRDLGLRFSHFAIKQDRTFDASFSISHPGQYIEGLASDFFGGELRGSLHCEVHSHPVLIYFGVGLFGMNADYVGPKIHLRYISSIPEIHHPPTITSGPPVLLDTTDAFDGKHWIQN